MSGKTFAVILAALGALNCVSVAVVTWLSVGAYQPMWPFPALILIETIILGIAGVWSVYQHAGWRRLIRWIVPGCLSVIVVLGAWSIGFFLLPAALVFLITAFIGQQKAEARWYEKLIAFAVGIVGQLLFFLLGRI